MPFLDSGHSSIEVTPGELLVGSGAQATWRVLNSDLAARHFSLRMAPDGSATVKPYSANTIVVVNGVAVSQDGVPVRTGDVIAAGLARFFYVEDLDAPRPEIADGPRTGHLIDEGERQAYPLAKRTITIGRDAGAAIPLRDPAVSRFHADVRSEAGEFVLYSMGSAGTHVNDQRVAAPKMLVEGDMIRIGATTFRFTRGALPEGVRVAKLGDQEDDSVARRPTETLATVGTGREVTGEGRESQPGRPRMMMVLLGTVALLAAAAYFVFGQG